MKWKTTIDRLSFSWASHANNSASFASMWLGYWFFGSMISRCFVIQLNDKDKRLSGSTASAMTKTAKSTDALCFKNLRLRICEWHSREGRAISNALYKSITSTQSVKYFCESYRICRRNLVLSTSSALRRLFVQPHRSDHTSLTVHWNCLSRSLFLYLWLLCIVAKRKSSIKLMKTKLANELICSSMFTVVEGSSHLVSANVNQLLTHFLAHICSNTKIDKQNPKFCSWRSRVNECLSGHEVEELKTTNSSTKYYR